MESTPAAPKQSETGKSNQKGVLMSYRAIVYGWKPEAQAWRTSVTLHCLLVAKYLLEITSKQHNVCVWRPRGGHIEKNSGNSLSLLQAFLEKQGTAEQPYARPRWGGSASGPGADPAAAAARPGSRAGEQALPERGWQQEARFSKEIITQKHWGFEEEDLLLSQNSPR